MDAKLWKKLLWHVLLTACAAAYSVGLTLLCEAVSRQEMSEIWSFLNTELGLLVMKNTALLVFVLIMALYFLTTKISAAMALVSVPMLVCHIISYFKLKLRSEPFYPWDVSLAGEATGILSSITLEPSKIMVMAIGFILGAVAFAMAMDLLVLRRNRPRYGASLLCGLVLAAVFGGCCTQLLSEDYLKANIPEVKVYNQPLTYQQNGFVYSFLGNYYHARLEAPEGYSAQSMAQLTGGYEEQEGSVEPNVIIVMSEAFADIWNAKNLTFDRELAPTFTALAEEYLSGQCMTSEFGGNTSNCEFEVLTGYSTYLLPGGTVPYMSYLNRQTDSIVSFLKSKDYYTVALHPFRRSFFSREKAYSLLGFDDYYSVEHFEGAERLRAAWFVSDDAVADRLIAEYEKNEPTGRGFFCHTVTMLNHTAYYASDWPEELQVGMEASCELTQAEYESLRSYATGIGYVEDNTTDEGRAALQSVPYLIWNNFQEEPTAVKLDMSMFHLLPYMTRMLDMDRPAFHSYMDTLFEQVRGVTRKVSLDGSGTPLLTLEDGAKEKFDEYLSIVYDGLIGKQYSSEALYG